MSVVVTDHVLELSRRSSMASLRGRKVSLVSGATETPEPEAMASEAAPKDKVCAFVLNDDKKTSIHTLLHTVFLCVSHLHVPWHLRALPLERYADVTRLPVSGM